MNKTSHTHPLVARPSRTAAFTLTELLTVIAIIGVLAAILIPTVGIAKASAQKSACLSNLRQISLGVLLYTQNNRNRLPSSNSDTINRGVWNPKVNGTTNFDSATAVASSIHLSTHISAYLETDRAETIWSCPANSAGAEASSAGSANREITYILNHNRSTNPVYPMQPFGTGGKPGAMISDLKAGSTGDAANVTDPSRIWMIADADSTNYGTYSGYPAKSAGSAIPMAHRGGRNYAFFDGHAEYRTPSNLPINPGDS